MITKAETTVLLVEDEPAVLDSFEMMLEDGYHVRKAPDGESALQKIDDDIDDDIDVVMLDRMLPGMSGDEVLAEIRQRDLDCRVVMVTAIDPDFDILEMGFDDYLKKPPTQAELNETIVKVLERAEFGDRVSEYHSLLSKQSTLEVEKDRDELAASEEYQELQDRIAELEEELDEDDNRLLEDTEFVGALQDIGSDPESGEPGR